MPNSRRSRAALVALISATSFTLASCASSKMTSAPQAEGSESARKEYQWKDMSLGKNFYGPPISSSQQATPPASQ